MNFQFYNYSTGGPSGASGSSGVCGSISKSLCETEVCKEKGVTTLSLGEVIVPINLIVTNGCRLSPDSAPVTVKLEAESILTSSGFNWTKLSLAPPLTDLLIL